MKRKTNAVMISNKHEFRYLATLRNPKTGERLDAYAKIDSRGKRILPIGLYLQRVSKKKLDLESRYPLGQGYPIHPEPLPQPVGMGYLQDVSDLRGGLDDVEWMVHLYNVQRKGMGLGLMLICAAPLAVAWIQRNRDGYVFSPACSGSLEGEALMRKALDQGLAYYDLSDYDINNHLHKIRDDCDMPDARRIITAKNAVLSGYVVDLCPRLMTMFYRDILAD